MKITRYTPQSNGWMDTDPTGFYVDIRDLIENNTVTAEPDGEARELDKMERHHYVLWDGQICVPDRLRWDLVRITDNHRYDVSKLCKDGHKFPVVRLVSLAQAAL